MWCFSMKKKGFTLIELLAVIVILAIIALIATPIILGIINSAKRQAFLNSANGLLDAGEKFFAMQELNDEETRNYMFTFEDGVQTSDDNNKLVGFKGKSPDSGSLVISKDNKERIAIWSDELKKCAYKGFSDETATFNDLLNTKESCYVDSAGVKSTWFWVNYNLSYEMAYITNKEKREAVIDQLSSYGINTLYLVMEKNHIEDTYKDFILYANKKDISIYLLEGDPTSIMESNYTKTIDDRIDEIVDFNNKMKTQNINAKIEGIHYDIEFYGDGSNNMDGLGPWIGGQSEAAKSSGRRRAYINFTKEAWKYAKQKQIRIEYDITQELSKFTYYDELGIEKNMAEELLKNSDAVSIMYYVTMYKFITTNNQLTFTGTMDVDGSSVNVINSTVEFINKYHKEYTIGTELSQFRKDERKVEACKDSRPSFVNELVPTYIDVDLKYNLTYLRDFHKKQRTEIVKYQNSKNFDAEIGIAYHDVWEFLNLTGYKTEIVDMRINNFENDYIKNTYNCVQ